MAKLRNFQFLRNNTIAGPFDSYALARTAAETAFGELVLQDGEIALYSYKLTVDVQENGDAATVHTLLGIKRTNGIEILGNYDELTAEYKSYVASEIAKLNSEVTGSNNNVSVTVKQVDGKIDSVTVVAPSLTSAIEALDVEAFSLTEVTGTELKGYQISEVDGKIVKGQTAETLLTFASAPTAENKVVTQSEITALNATVTSNDDGVNFQVKVVETDGVITAVNVVEDKTVNATDVEDAIETAIAGLESEVENETGDIKVKVTQANGELTAVVVTDTLKDVAHSGAATDVTIADADNLIEATTVEGALAELAGDIADLAGDIADLDAARLSAGKGIDIDGTTINADLKLSITNETTGEGESTVTTTYLYIKDTEGNEISKLDASEFVKDGFLQSVVLDEENGELVFTWNTDAEGAGEQNQVTRIAISKLCDVYTAKENDWIKLNGFEFFHKTQTSAGTYGNNTNDVTVDSTTSQSFKVPTLTVDAAGHVTAASEKTVTITLPESINTAIQDGAGVDTTYIKTTVARNATNTNQLDVKATAKIGDYAAEGQVDGLATTTATKTYVDGKIGALKDYNTETTVSTAADSGIIVTPTIVNADAVNEQRTYAISLATVARVDNATTEGVAGNPTTSSFADDTTTFTYVKAVHTDANGRVTGIDTETVTEFFDAGTY